MTMIAQHTDAIESDQAQATRDILLSARFLCHFDPAGRIQLAELKAGALYLEATEIPAAITAGALPRELLMAILAAATTRLYEQMPEGAEE